MHAIVLKFFLRNKMTINKTVLLTVATFMTINTIQKIRKKNAYLQIYWAAKYLSSD